MSGIIDEIDKTQAGDAVVCEPLCETRPPMAERVTSRPATAVVRRLMQVGRMSVTSAIREATAGRPDAGVSDGQLAVGRVAVRSLFEAGVVRAARSPRALGARRRACFRR